MYSDLPQEEMHHQHQKYPEHLNVKQGSMLRASSQPRSSGMNSHDKPGELDQNGVLGPPGDGRHVRRLCISLGLMFFTGCISPLILRFVLEYVGHFSVSISVSVPSAIFGVFSLVGYIQRTWSLGRRHSPTRPVGGSRWAFDYFHWNFTFGLIFVTVVISMANALKPPQTQVAALPLSILLIQVGAQLLLVQILAAAKVRYFCRISSMPRNSEVLRPALFTIIEDLVAVEGKQGTVWRAAYDKRYQEHKGLRDLLTKLSWMWGATSLAVAAVDFVLIFKTKNIHISWIIGWSVPWIYAGIMSIPTYFMIKSSRY